MPLGCKGLSPGSPCILDYVSLGKDMRLLPLSLAQVPTAPFLPTLQVL